MRIFAAIWLVIGATAATADTLIATRTIRARELITPADLRVDGIAVPGALSDPRAAIGQEARYTLYAGRPIRPGDLSRAAEVERNDLVQMTFQNGALRIHAEGRALGRGAVGDRIRVMNLASRTTVTGTVSARGTITVP